MHTQVAPSGEHKYNFFKFIYLSEIVIFPNFWHFVTFLYK